MNNLNSIAAAVLGTVLNTLWQAAAATALVWLALRFSNLSSGARYRVWWAWLAILLMLPAVPRKPATASSVAVRSSAFAEPLADARGSDQSRNRKGAVGHTVIAQPSPRVQVKVKRGPLVALGIWLALILVQAARLLWSFLHLWRLKRDAHRPSRELRENFEAWVMACGVHRPVRLLVSAGLTSPMAVGFRHPAVILPEALIGKLTVDDLDHVTPHAQAHVARRDDWTNLAARIATPLVGWHPAAAWVLRRIDREREIACDDWVVAATGAPRPYAASLARLFELCWTKNRDVLATGMAGRGSHLGDRIEILVHRTGASQGRRSLARMGLCAAVLLVLLVAGSRAPQWVAFAQDAPARAAFRPVVFANPQSFLSALVAAGYGDLPVDDIISLKNHGLSPDFLRGVSQSGWGKLTVQELIDLRQRGVSPEYLRDMHAAGFRDLNISGVIELRNRGVQPDYPREVHSLGFGPYSAQQIIELAAHGVHLELFRALKEGGFTKLEPNELFEAQNSGVQANNLREAKQYGPALTLNQLIKLKRAGVI